MKNKDTLIAVAVAALVITTTTAVRVFASESDTVRASQSELLEPGVRLERYDVGATAYWVFTPYPMPQAQALPVVLLAQSSSTAGIADAADMAKSGAAVVAYQDVNGAAQALAFARAQLPVDSDHIVLR